jgi:hypothetical protein
MSRALSAELMLAKSSGSALRQVSARPRLVSASLLNAALSEGGAGLGILVHRHGSPVLRPPNCCP